MLNTPQDFMQTSERVIVQQFLRLRGAVLIHTPYGNAVYVPARRADAVLLIAHTDTVWCGANIQLQQNGDMIASAIDGVGIGADDRAGIAALWALRGAGHSLLLVPEEETGCKGSAYIAKHARHILARHNYMIQFDRRGGLDLVTYDCDNPAFDDYLIENLQGYAIANGSFSDIAELAPVADIAAVNISIGFRAEHTGAESLNLAEWRHTVETVRDMLARPCPHFEYIERAYSTASWLRGWDTHDGYGASSLAYEDDYRDICLTCNVELIEDLGYAYCPECMHHFDRDDLV